MHNLAKSIDEEELLSLLKDFYNQAEKNAETGKANGSTKTDELDKVVNPLGLKCAIHYGSGGAAACPGIVFIRQDIINIFYHKNEDVSPTKGIYIWFCYENQKLYLEFGRRRGTNINCKAFNDLYKKGSFNRKEGTFKCYDDFENHKDAILNDFLEFVEYYKNIDVCDFKLNNIMNTIKLTDNCYGLEIPLQDSSVKFKNCKPPYNELNKKELKVFTKDMYIAWKVEIDDVSKCITECCQKGIFERGYVQKTYKYIQQHNKKYDFRGMPKCVLIKDTRTIQTSSSVDYFSLDSYSIDGREGCSHLALNNVRIYPLFTVVPHLFWLELQPKRRGFEVYMCFSVSILKSKDNNKVLLNQNINTQYAILALDENCGYIPMETYRFLAVSNNSRKRRQFMLSVLDKL